MENPDNPVSEDIMKAATSDREREVGKIRELGLGYEGTASQFAPGGDVYKGIFDELPQPPAPPMDHPSLFALRYIRGYVGPLTMQQIDEQYLDDGAVVCPINFWRAFDGPHPGGPKYSDLPPEGTPATPVVVVRGESTFGHFASVDEAKAFADRIKGSLLPMLPPMRNTAVAPTGVEVNFPEPTSTRQVETLGPIPADVFWSEDESMFWQMMNGKGYPSGAAFMLKWNDRGGEFPVASRPNAQGSGPIQLYDDGYIDPNRAIKSVGSVNLGAAFHVLLVNFQRPDTARASDIEPMVKLIVQAIHLANVDKGWWSDPVTRLRIERNMGEMLMLAASEVAEAAEGLFGDLMDDKLKHLRMFPVEIADALIRLSDTAGGTASDFVVEITSVIMNGELHAEIMAEREMDQRHHHAFVFDGFDVPRYLLRIVMDLSAAMEGHRKGRPFTRPLARAYMRLVFLQGITGEDVFGAVDEKTNFNKVREDHMLENRLKDGGKKY